MLCLSCESSALNVTNLLSNNQKERKMEKPKMKVKLKLAVNPHTSKQAYVLCPNLLIRFHCLVAFDLLHSLQPPSFNHHLCFWDFLYENTLRILQIRIVRLFPYSHIRISTNKSVNQ